eukprot:GGOE01019459.1.p1 GENE.GGOE01019459.1~~GGOE01019459.1.p1  ORF type:complete len:576 (+),score=135.04 GGOE01019459.1:78-1730(+)
MTPTGFVVSGVAATAATALVIWMWRRLHPCPVAAPQIHATRVRQWVETQAADFRHPDVRDPACFGPSLVLFSGGSAFNNTAVELTHFTTRTSYIVPVSDNGGSSREIIRVLGGPAIGDIRARLIRLAAPRNAGDEAVIGLLRHRLSWESRDASKMEFLHIVDGTHSMWKGIPEAFKQTLRAFLLHFFLIVMRQESVQELPYDVVNVAKELATHFDYRGGSIGNFMLTGARLFFGSLEAAIFWFSNLAGIPRSSYVVPVINVSSKVTLAVRLRSGQEIIGQGNITGPAPMEAPHGVPQKSRSRLTLPDAIDRVYYISEHGSEILPPLNPVTLEHLNKCDAVVYTMGSLYTSILPSLVLRGIGAAIAARSCPKILILNGVPDRETSWQTRGRLVEHMMAVDIVAAVTKALNQNEDVLHPFPCQQFITHVFYLQACMVVDSYQLEELAALGLVAIEIPREFQDGFYYDNRMLVKSIRSVMEGWEVRQMCDQRRRSTHQLDFTTAMMVIGSDLSFASSAGAAVAPAGDPQSPQGSPASSLSRTSSLFSPPQSTF